MANYTGYQGAGNSSEHAAVYPHGGNTSPGARVRALLPPGHPFHRLPPEHPIWKILGRKLGGGVKQFPRGELGPPGLLGPPDTTGGDTFSPPSLEGGPTPAGGDDTGVNTVPDPQVDPQRTPTPGGIPWRDNVIGPPALSLSPGYTPDGSEFGRTVAPGGGVDDIRERLLRQFRGTTQPRYGLDALRNYVQQHQARRASAMPKRPTPILPQRTARKIPY